MQITDSAKAILETYLKEENKKGIIFQAAGHGCHMQLGLDFTDGSAGEDINGIMVEMNENTKIILEDCILDSRDGKLIFKAGGCGSCSSDCDGCC